MIIAVVRIVPSSTARIMVQVSGAPGREDKRRQHAERGRLGRRCPAGIDRAHNDEENEQRCDQVLEREDPSFATIVSIGVPPFAGRTRQATRT